MNVKNSVQGVFFCAGARNNLLLKHLQEFPLYFEIDERIASFKALGLGKSRNKLAVVCTTSGTAVSECLSAMVEAFHSEAPLLLISADRPLKLQGSGAPQTIDHEIITRGFRRDYKDLTLEEFTQLDFSTLSLPAHVNVRITTADEKDSGDAPKETVDFKSFMEGVKTPLFLFSHGPSHMRELIEKFLPYGLPFYAEVTSGAKDLSPIKTERELLALFKKGFFDGVVRIGHTPLSKLWRILEGKKCPVYNFDSRGMRGLSYGSVEKLTPQEILSHEPFWDSLPKGHFEAHGEDLAVLDKLIHKYPRSEISLMKKLHDALPEGSHVFLGNSLPIRYFELVQSKKFHIMANRGVNGIDGQIASAGGWCLSTNEDTYCILGDMSFSYDLSALLSLHPRLKCIIINNSGGRIFETLKLDHRLVMEHQRNFENLSRGFGLKYGKSVEELKEGQIIELTPDLDQSREFEKEWQT